MIDLESSEHSFKIGMDSDDKDMGDGWVINPTVLDIVHKHNDYIVSTYFPQNGDKDNRCRYCGESAPEKYVTMINLMALQI